MKVAIVTGSAGLIGSESVRFFSDKMDLVVGIDNDQRAYFFGKDASTERSKNDLEESIQNYRHHAIDIRNYEALKTVLSNMVLIFSLLYIRLPSQATTGQPKNH
jgi:CDP-paratose 2-epimerase